MQTSLNFAIISIGTQCVLLIQVHFDKTDTMEEQSQDEQCLRKAEEYVKEHDIQRIVKDCIVQLCIHRPDNPYSFLRQHFASLEKVYTGCANKDNPLEKNSVFQLWEY